MRVSRLPLLLVLALPAFVITAPAGARDAEDLNVSRSAPIQQREYASIPLNNTEAAAGLGTQILLHRPAECRTAGYCDVVDINVDASAFTDRDAYELRIVLTWENPDVNDLDLFIYDKEQGRRVTASATAVSPEKASVDRPPTGKIFAVVNNFSGPNLGYRMKAELYHQGKLKEIPKFERATPRPPMFTPLPEATPRRGVTPPEQELAPSATLAPVLTPGPDGAPTSLSLEAIEAGVRASDDGMSWWVVLISAIAAAGVLGGTGFLLFRRVRARRA